MEKTHYRKNQPRDLTRCTCYFDNCLNNYVHWYLLVYHKNVMLSSATTKVDFCPRRRCVIYGRVTWVTVIRWTEPHFNTFKLNMDGCSHGNPGEYSIGGVIRDQLGIRQHLLMLFYYFIICTMILFSSFNFQIGSRYLFLVGFLFLNVS